MLFASQYALTTSDFAFLSSYRIAGEKDHEVEQRQVRFRAYNYLKNLRLVESYDYYEGVILAMVSAKFKRIIGFGFQNLTGFANNAIHGYPVAWPFILKAFRYYEFWDLITAEDTKGSFIKKVNEFSQVGKPPPIVLIDLIESLFPEVFTGNVPTSSWINAEDINNNSTAS